LLARKVGDLQAKVIAMDSLGQRIAEAAGVANESPELQASLDQSVSVMDDHPAESAALLWSAEGLGRQLDMLTRQLSEKQSWFSTLDVLMTQRAGMEAGLPTH